MNTDTEQRKYELMVILSGEIPESEVAKELDEIRKFLKESTGGISFEDVWGRRDLAFRLKRQNRGHYAVFNFSANPAAIIELRTNIRLNQSVLRHLLILVPEDYAPVRYEKEALEVERVAPERRPRKKVSFVSPKYPPAPESVEAGPKAPEGEKPRVAGKEDEEKLKKVEKKLEEILENPDIDIK